MGLPKNYNETVNMPKIIESLNGLNFYKVNFIIEVSDDYDNKQRQSEIIGTTMTSDYEVISRLDDRKLSCSKNYSALNDETSLRKITEWLEIKMSNNEIVSYEILSIESNSFYEELDRMGLLNLLHFNTNE